MAKFIVHAPNRRNGSAEMVTAKSASEACAKYAAASGLDRFDCIAIAAVSEKENYEAELLAALKGLIAASGHMSPFGDGKTVQTVRKASAYMAALEAAERVIAKVEG